MAGKIKIAIAGMGNCASSLIQGLFYYKNTKDGEFIPGLMHNNMGGYRIRDIELVAAFDVDKRKVGKDASEALFSGDNNTAKFCDIPPMGIKVEKGPVLDGIGRSLSEMVPVSEAPEVDVINILKRTGAEILINYLPVGSEKAVRNYAEIAMKAGVGMVNCMPVFIASDPVWGKRFADAKVPIVGDDIKSQVGATIIHRTLTKLFIDRGMKIDRTYQLNVGGNNDFKNMLDRERLISKKISKTEAVTAELPYDIGSKNVHVGPSDYVPWLKDNKVCYLRIEGKHFGDVPMEVELRLSVEDSPNSAGVVVDAIRCCRIALDKGIGGPLWAPAAYLMKHPPIQITDRTARKLVNKFIETGVNAKPTPEKEE
jgi:myo-inositol-1-phosphate synthase